MLFVATAVVFGQKIHLLLSTPWTNDDDHMWGAINMSMVAFSIIVMLYFWFRDGTAALQERLAKGGEAIAKALSKSPFGGTR